MNNQVTHPFFISNEFFSSFSIHINFFSIFLSFFKIPFFKEIGAITAVQLLVRLFEKFLCVIWNLGTITYPKFVTLRLFQIQMDSTKSINSFEKKIHLIIYGTIFFWQFVNNFSALLLWKIYFFHFFNVINFFQVFIISRSTEILMVLNFLLRVYT